MKEINWQEQAQRNFDPVKIWMDAMRWREENLSSYVLRGRKGRDTLLAKNPNHYFEHNKRIRDILLAKNPNHFKDLSRKYWSNKNSHHENMSV